MILNDITECVSLRQYAKSSYNTYTPKNKASNLSVQSKATMLYTNLWLYKQSQQNNRQHKSLISNDLQNNINILVYQNIMLPKSTSTVAQTELIHNIVQSQYHIMWTMDCLSDILLFQQEVFWKPYKYKPVAKQKNQSAEVSKK